MTDNNRDNDPENDDPFNDIEQYRLSQNFAAEIGVERVITTVPVHKPHRQTFIRTHPLAEMHLDTYVIDWDDDKETYLVAKNMRSSLASEIVTKKLIPAITRDCSSRVSPVSGSVISTVNIRIRFIWTSSAHRSLCRLRSSPVV